LRPVVILKFHAAQFWTLAMKNAAKLAEKNSDLLAGTEALDLYLKAMLWNLRSIMRQTDVLEAMIMEMEKKEAEHIMGGVSG
jgi:hypothetical protein